MFNALRCFVLCILINGVYVRKIRDNSPCSVAPNKPFIASVLAKSVCVRARVCVCVFVVCVCACMYLSTHLVFLCITATTNRNRKTERTKKKTHKTAHQLNFRTAARVSTVVVVYWHILYWYAVSVYMRIQHHRTLQPNSQMLCTRESERQAESDKQPCYRCCCLLLSWCDVWTLSLYMCHTAKTQCLYPTTKMTTSPCVCVRACVCESWSVCVYVRRPLWVGFFFSLCRVFSVCFGGECRMVRLFT